MGRKRRRRNRHIINVNTSVTDFPNAMPEEQMYQPISKRPTIVRPTYLRPSLLPHPDQVIPISDIPLPRHRLPHLGQVLPFSNQRFPRPSLLPHPDQVNRISDIPLPRHRLPRPNQVAPISATTSRFSLNSVPRRWLSNIPYLHAKFPLPRVPVSVPVAIVPPLPGVQVRVSAANTIPPTSTTSDSIKSSGTRILAEKLSVATDPVTVQSIIHQVTKPSVNAEGSDTVLNVETPNEVDDVIFLFSVKPEEGKLIEVVDLSEDPNEISSNRNLVLSSSNPISHKETLMKQGLNSSTDSQDVLEIYSSPVSEKSKDPGIPIRAGTKRKREENIGTHCSVCHTVSEGVCSKDANQLFISKCGHIFCVTCLKNLVPYKCTECNAAISNLCKVIF